jgi:hypothetical protein
MKWSCVWTKKLRYNKSPRQAATKPAKPGCPVRLEHEYQRLGALNLFAGFDTRTGQGRGKTSVVGVDLGVKTLATLSSGRTLCWL